jgi:hypothetical protein
VPVDPHTNVHYYKHWLAALDGLLLEKGLVSAEDIEKRTAMIASGQWDHHDAEEIAGFSSIPTT